VPTSPCERWKSVARSNKSRNVEVIPSVGIISQRKEINLLYILIMSSLVVYIYIYIYIYSKLLNLSELGHIIGRLGKDKFKFYKHSGEGNKVIKKSQQPALC
jgi:hypothetical protein